MEGKDINISKISTLSKSDDMVVDGPIFVCIDASGSTQGNVFYWSKVYQILEDMKVELPDCNAIFWDTSMINFPLGEALKQINNSRTSICGGGTSPSCFIHALSRTKNNRLVLITDGQVGNNEVQICDTIIDQENIKFSMVHCHFLNTGGSINLSVSSPFTRSCQFRIFQDENLVASGNSGDDIILDKYSDNPELFVDEFESIYQLIAIKTRGRSDFGLRNHILDLQASLQKTFAIRNNKKMDKEEEDPFLKIRKIVENQSNDKSDDSAAVEIMKETINKLKKFESSSLAKMVENNIQSLIRLCDKTSDYGFDILKPSRVDRSSQIEEVDITQVTDSGLIGVETNYICPIMYETGTPCLLITESENGSVTDGLEKDDIDMLLDMPLFILSGNKNEGLVQKIIKHFDHPVGFDVAKELFNMSSTPQSPFTRNRINCALTFGHDENNDKANNFTLSKIFFSGNKLVGVPELWLCVLFFTLVERVPYLAENIPLVEAFRSYISYRLKKYKSRITLTGISIEPIIKSPLDISLWYCVASPRIVINKASAENRLRSFGASSRYLTKILSDILGYKFNKSWTDHQMDLYSTFSWMMKEERKDDSNWRKLVRAQYQGSLILPNGYIVMLDGPSQEGIYSAYGKLPEFIKISFAEVFALSKLVDRTKSINNIDIPNDLVPDTNIPEPVYNFGYNKEWTEADYLSLPKLQICPATYRPYSIDVQKNIAWQEAAKQLYGCSSEKLISHFHLFSVYVMSNIEFPNNKWEFIEWIDKKMKLSGKGKDTLPTHIVSLVKNLFDSYEEVFGKDFCNVKAVDAKNVFVATQRMPPRQEKEKEYLNSINSQDNTINGVE